MLLTRHSTPNGSRWASDGFWFPNHLSLSELLAYTEDEIRCFLDKSNEPAGGEFPLLSPVEDGHEVWAAGVTYLRSRVEREAESTVADVYAKVYEADRPELFFKSSGWRTVGQGGLIRVRNDSAWNVPEPELTLVLNRGGEIIGYTAGNDVSSRSIEGENPLYLPQAKVYDGSCAVGPGIVLATAQEVSDLPISLSIKRLEAVVFSGETRTSLMKRSPAELARFLFDELSFPSGAFLMTGTGIVPTQEFTLLPADEVTVNVGELTLRNVVGS